MKRTTRWQGGAITKHYRGDEGDVKVLIGGILQAFAGMRVDEYEVAAANFYMASTQHLCGLSANVDICPMVELLRYLESKGFRNFIASGGDRDFMRSVTQEIYGIPPHRVIGSSNALRYQDDGHGGSVVYRGQPDVFDDGPIKPVRIWSRIGRRPIMPGG